MKPELKNKKILLGVTGSIAAYKTPFLVRELLKHGAQVKVIMTPSATQFVTPLIMINLTRHPVITEMFDEHVQSGGAWHIELAHWADMMIIAPCSAATLGRLANGIPDTALVAVATALPREAPLLIAPAMDSTMWQHPSTQRNIRLMKDYGAIIIPPEEGVLASGLVGPGRMPEIEVLVEAISNSFSSWMDDETSHWAIIDDRQKAKNSSYIENIIESSIEPLDEAVEKDKFNAELELEQLKKKSQVNNADHGNIHKLNGKRVLITAGPTYEKIDDIRYIANYSSGKMGYALAAEAAANGAIVTLISGPVTLETPEGVTRINVTSAEEMFQASVKNFPGTDISILAAAVADFTPAEPKSGKIKKTETGPQLSVDLTVTKDILATLGSMKSSSQKLIGFALEAVDEIEYGKQKLIKKNCDMIVVNSSSKERSGFGGDDNTITIINKDLTTNSYPPMSKTLCAVAILKRIAEILP